MYRNLLKSDGHWLLWRGWKKRMIRQNWQKSNAKKRLSLTLEGGLISWTLLQLHMDTFLVHIAIFNTRIANPIDTCNYAADFSPFHLFVGVIPWGLMCAETLDGDFDWSKATTLYRHKLAVSGFTQLSLSLPPYNCMSQK
mgnify:CR=1 FL=1